MLEASFDCYKYRQDTTIRPTDADQGGNARHAQGASSAYSGKNRCSRACLAAVDETGISTLLDEPFPDYQQSAPPSRQELCAIEHSVRATTLLGTHIKAVVFFKSLLEMRKKPRLGGNFFEYVSVAPRVI
jgi:hypothetical protein